MTDSSKETGEEEPLFNLTVDLNVLDHLADGLYSSVAAVLTEAVANAWDADARNVRLDLGIDNDCIVISDDGIGMDVRSVNECYLRVGYQRRKTGETTEELGRPVMGRKGIGKLSLFSIADEIRLETRRRGRDIVALRIDVEELRDQMKEGHTDAYHPTPVNPKHSSKLADRGTVIVLSKLKKKRLRETDPDSLRRRLARRFSVIGSTDFRVFVDGREVTPRDREDLKFTQYVWVFEGTDFSVPDGVPKPKLFDLPNRAESWPMHRMVRGWIGTVDRPRQLALPEGNLNSVVVISRGRLVQEDILPKISGAGLFTKYVTGQVEADWLDETKDDDIVTSDRQRLREDDERVGALVAFLSGRLNEIGNRWTELRNKDKTDELRSRYPEIDRWLNKLNNGWRRKAENLLGRIASMEIESGDEEKDRKELVRHAIYGFERLRLKGEEESLAKALDSGIDALLKLLSDRDALEAAHYRDIVKSRLEKIEFFKKAVTDDQKEKFLQKYLFEHLWLLDPSWEDPGINKEMERRLKLEPIFSNEQKDRYGRIDIAFRTVAGKHVIVELKRASARKGLYELAEQGAKYVSAYKNSLPPEEKDRAQIEVIFVVGKAPEEPSDRIEQTMNGVSPGSRIVTYDQLTDSAISMYRQYLERTEEIDFIDQVLS